LPDVKRLLLIGLATALATASLLRAQAANIFNDPCIAKAAWRAGLVGVESAAKGSAISATKETEVISDGVENVTSLRFPELTGKQIHVRAFDSESDYFRTRFSLWRFFLPMRMRYFVDVNPRLFKRAAPSSGICSILGHELAHVSYMSNGIRLRLLGLLRLGSASYRAKFERKADLEAISRGFAPGLKDYRAWVYSNIPPSKLAEKELNYFSPAEIDALLCRLQQRPELLSEWEKNVPLGLEEIKSSGR